jgi:hypothetical protein
MTNSSLIRTAGILAALLGLFAFVAAHRLGYFARPTMPDWELRNSLLETKPGTQAVLRPGRTDQKSLRYWFVRFVPEPAVDDASVTSSPVGQFAHVRAGMSARRSGESVWYFDGVAFFSFRQMGTLTVNEWLEEIRLVEESDGDGGRRLVLRALFQSPGGATSWYIYDPERSAETNATSGFGWERVERHAAEQSSEVFYLTPDGLKVPPPLRSRSEGSGSPSGKQPVGGK